MADLAQQISEARQHGYSDDDIVGYLGSSHPELAPKIQEAQTHGYGSADIIGHLAQTPPESKSVGGFLKNTVTSAGRFASDVAGAVMHPGRTVEGVTGLLEGMAEKSGFKPVAGVSHQQNVDALMNLYKDRYGSIENFKNSLYTDPVGVLADIATLTSGIGAGAKGVELAADAAKLSRVADTAGAISRGAQAVSGVTDPLKLAGKAADATGVTALAQRGAQAASTALTRGALRGGLTSIGNTKDPAAIAAIVRTNENAVSEMNSRNLPLSEQGVQDLTAGLNDLLQQRQQAIRRGGAPVDPAKVELSLDDAISRREWQVNPNADLKQMEQVRQNFRQRTGGQPRLDAKGKPIRDPQTGVPQYTQGPAMPVDEAEALKEGTYRNNKYGAEAPPHLVATAEGEKSLAHGLMAELERSIPELGAINPELQKKLDLQGVLAKAVAKHTQDGGFWGNLVKQTIGSKEGALKIGGVAGAGYALGSPTAGAALALAQAVLSDPAVKQRLAIAINKAQQLDPGKYGVPSMGTAISRINEYTSRLQPQQ